MLLQHSWEKWRPNENGIYIYTKLKMKSMKFLQHILSPAQFSFDYLLTQPITRHRTANSALIWRFHSTCYVVLRALSDFFHLNSRQTITCNISRSTTVKLTPNMQSCNPLAIVKLVLWPDTISSGAISVRRQDILYIIEVTKDNIWSEAQHLRITGTL